MRVSHGRVRHLCLTCHADKKRQQRDAENRCAVHLEPSEMSLCLCHRPRALVTAHLLDHTPTVHVHACSLRSHWLLAPVSLEGSESQACGVTLMRTDVSFMATDLTRCRRERCGLNTNTPHSTVTSTFRPLVHHVRSPHSEACGPVLTRSAAVELQNVRVAGATL